MCEKLKSENQTNMNIDMCVDIRPITSFLMHSVMNRASFSNAMKVFACFIKIYRNIVSFSNVGCSALL